MVIALVLIVICALFVLFAVGREPIPWTSRLRRMNAGVSHQAEWIAPDDINSKVRDDYLQAIEWLQDAANHQHLDDSSHYLTGRFLTRFQLINNTRISSRSIRFNGVLIARHHVKVRQFSENGSCCLVIDSQTVRKMKSFQSNHPDWMLVQELGDCTAVFRMAYDATEKRWKIEALVQELPIGWGLITDNGPVRLWSELPTSIGRDN